MDDFPDASIESRLLLCRSAMLTEEEFYANRNSHLTRDEVQSFFRLVGKRKSGIPLSYLTNIKEFWSIPFEVYPGVLIPRPETELIVDKVIEFSSSNVQIIVDIGTGCGNVAIALAKELPEVQIIATDVSRNAIRIAKANAARMSIPNIKIVHGSLFSPLEKLKLSDKCDFVVSNPPYVANEEWETLSSEIKRHEPRNALVSGETGLEYIQELVKGAPKFLKPGGYLVFEMGCGQRQRVLEMFEKEWSRVQSFKDLCGIPRVITARKRMR